MHAQFRPIDPSQWRLPAADPPQSLLALLRFSNGGDFATGDRWFQLFPALDPKGGLRAMILGYQLPEYMPMALPFAFNGGGTFYLFDMRTEAGNGEYPIVAAHAGSLGWDPDDHWLAGSTLLDACRGECNVDDLWPGEESRRALNKEGERRVDQGHKLGATRAYEEPARAPRSRHNHVCGD